VAIIDARGEQGVQGFFSHHRGHRGTEEDKIKSHIQKGLIREGRECRVIERVTRKAQLLSSVLSVSSVVRNPSVVRKGRSRPTEPCGGPRMNPSFDGGHPPRPIRHFRLAERRTQDRKASRAPFHRPLVQKTVTTITNLAGRLSKKMLGKSRVVGKWGGADSWHSACHAFAKRHTAGQFQQVKRLLR